MSAPYNVSTSVVGHAAALPTDEFKDQSVVLDFTQDSTKVESQELTMRVSFKDPPVAKQPDSPIEHAHAKKRADEEKVV